MDSPEKCKYTAHRLVAAVLATGLFLSVFGISCVGRQANVRSETTQNADEVKRISILFAGDLMQHITQVNSARQEDGSYDYVECFEYISPLLYETDLAVVNLETTLSPEGPYSGYPTFCSPAQLAMDVKRAGFDIALLANNHICDKGSDGIKHTIEALDSAGLYHTGAFTDSVRFRMENPLVIHRNGFSISILNYTYGTNGLPVPEGRVVNLTDTVAIARDLARIEPSDDNITLVCMHWGYEYHTTPSDEQTELAQWLGDNGVDLIIGGHPHVVQPLRIRTDSVGATVGVTAFSLGNFVSNQQREGTDGGLVLRLNIVKRGSGRPEIYPEHFYVWNYKPVIGGKRRYRIIPSYHADSLLRGDSLAYENYSAFLSGIRTAAGAENEHYELAMFAE